MSEYRTEVEVLALHCQYGATAIKHICGKQVIAR